MEQRQTLPQLSTRWKMFFVDFPGPKQTDPYGTVGSLGAEDRQRAGEQPVCTLLEFLEVAARYDKLVIFDLYRPPQEHPYSNSWIQHTLDVIRNESTIKPSQVTLHYKTCCHSNIRTFYLLSVAIEGNRQINESCIQ